MLRSGLVAAAAVGLAACSPPQVPDSPRAGPPAAQTQAGGAAPACGPASGHAAGAVAVRYDSLDGLPAWINIGRVRGGGEMDYDRTRVTRNAGAQTAEGWVRLRHREPQLEVYETEESVVRARYRVEEARYIYCCPSESFVFAERRFTDDNGARLLTIPYDADQAWRPVAAGGPARAAIASICRGGATGG